MKLKRYNIKKIYSNPKLKRELIAESTRITMLREGIELTIQQCLDSYDEVIKEKYERPRPSKNSKR